MAAKATAASLAALWAEVLELVEAGILDPSIVENGLQKCRDGAFLVSVNYDLSIQEMIDRTGPWNEVRGFLAVPTMGFRVDREGRTEEVLELYWPAQPISDRNLERRLVIEGLERVRELQVFLAFLESNPQLVRTFPIASGFSWQDAGGTRRTAVTYGSETFRSLTTSARGHLQGDWRSDTRFLVRRLPHS